LAIEEAMVLFDESWDGNVFDLFEWKATEIKEKRGWLKWQDAHVARPRSIT